MIFREQKIENGYTYDVEDVFGKLHIESSVQLNGEILDDMVVLLLRKNLRAEFLEGEIKHDKGVVRYSFHRASLWEDDDECENIHTSTSAPESASTPTSRLKTPILSWLSKFGAAFREAWKKAGYQKEKGESHLSK